MTVVHLKPRARKQSVKISTPSDLAAIDRELCAVFVKLSEQHGTYAVSTVAFRYILDVIVTAQRSHRPIEEKWLTDLRKRFDAAMRGEKL